MDLQLSSEQVQLRDSVERFVRDEYGFARRRALAAAEPGYDEACWRRYAEFGWLGVGFDESDGGFGGGPEDVAIVMEGVGLGLLLEPLLANVVLAGRMLAAAGTPAQRAEWLAPMIAGERKLALAFAEPDARYELASCSTRARRDGGAWVLDGAKTAVVGGAAADVFVVIARSAGDVRDANGLGAFIVDANAPGVAVRRYPTHDGTRAADLRLDRVRIDASRALGADGIHPVLERVIDHGIAAIAAEAVGAMTALCAMTLEHLKTRVQFGRPIGANQALQHRVVDMHIALDEARSIALYGALTLAEPDGAARRKALSTTKIEIDRTARLVGQEAVQMHGAMGVTEDLAVGHYFKRLSMIGVTFGDSTWHLRRHAAPGAAAG